MKFEKPELLEIMEFCQKVIEKPRMMEDQPHKREGVYLWCEDWKIIEICKYIINGREMYYNDPPPHRLKNNPLWSKDDIAQKSEKIIEEFKTITKITEHLKGIINGSA